MSKTKTNFIKFVYVSPGGVRICKTMHADAVCEDVTTEFYRFLLDVSYAKESILDSMAYVLEEHQYGQDK